MVHKAKKVRSALTTKGFEAKEKKRHTRFFYITLAGRRSTVNTTMSRGRDRDISDDLAKKMAAQCRLTHGEFDDFVRCTLDQIAYEALLVERCEL